MTAPAPDDLAAWLGSYREVATVSVAACAAVAVLHLAVRRVRPGRWSPSARSRLLGRLSSLGVVLLVAGLGATALGGLWAMDGVLHGWVLFAHVGLGGGFLVALALLALFRSAAHRPGRAELHGRLARLGFWLVLVSGLVVGGSMMIATLPLLGGASMELAIELHRWAGLALLLSTLLYAHGLLLGRWARTPRGAAD